MISLPLAQKLSRAGLSWIPAGHDFFAVPDRDLDDKVFVITDMMAYVELIQGRPVATFHGTVEWALDFVQISDLVWLPTEEQLRQAIIERLPAGDAAVLELSSGRGRTICAFRRDGHSHRFEAPDASLAYAGALLHLLLTGGDGRGGNGIGR